MIQARGAAPRRLRWHRRHVPAREYSIVVEGELGTSLASAFPEMTVTHAYGNTVLEGPIRDQSHLQGLLQLVSDLGLTLLSVSALQTGANGR